MSYRSIREAASEIHAGIITPTELVWETLASIDEQDHELQAYVTVMREQAMQDAERAEQEIRTGLYRGPLHGVPIAIKDLIAVQGVRLGAGSKVLHDFVATENATVVDLLRKNGAIIIGKTATYEFAYGSYCPPTRNPWKLAHTTGGSSGGSAAAVSAGMCLGALGSDTGGSIRIPSACCGVTGLKPTYGRVSCHGVIPLSWSLDHVGPIGQNAADCALLFDAIAGYDPHDPNSVSRPRSTTHETLTSEGASGPLSLQGLKLGVPRDSFVAPLDPEVRNAWKAALLVLQEAGAQIVEVEVPRQSMHNYRLVQKPEATLAHQEKGWMQEKLDLYSETVRTRLLEGQEIKAIDYLQAQHQRRLFSATLRSLMQSIDALVLPTQPMPAIEAILMGQEISVDGQRENANEAMLRLTMPFNLSGLPAIAFPCGVSSSGLPLSLQVAGKPFEEGLILRIAHTYQGMTDWQKPALRAD